MPTAAPRLLVSQLLAEDAELLDIVAEFVGGLPKRISEMKEAYDRLDWDSLVMFAHRLKGAGGSYGYPDIGRVAARLEADFRVHRGDQFVDSMAELAQLSEAAAAALPRGSVTTAASKGG